MKSSLPPVCAGKGERTIILMARTILQKSSRQIRKALLYQGVSENRHPYLIRMDRFAQFAPMGTFIGWAAGQNPYQHLWSTRS